MAQPPVTHDQIAFVEESGLVNEAMGIPRMAGRILGWLLICDPPHQSHAQLAEALQASKGSISTMTRMLIQHGIAERTSLPGDRREYIRIPDQAVAKMIRQSLQRTSIMRQLAEKGLKSLAGTPPARQARLRDMCSLYAFLEREMPVLIDRWLEENRPKTSPKKTAARR